MTSSVNLAGLRVVLLGCHLSRELSSLNIPFGCALNPWTADGMHAEIFSEPEGSLSDQRKGSLLPPARNLMILPSPFLCLIAAVGWACTSALCGHITVF